MITALPRANQIDLARLAEIQEGLSHLPSFLVQVLNDLRIHNRPLAMVIEQELASTEGKPLSYKELAWQAGPVLLVVHLMGLTKAANHHPQFVQIIRDCCQLIKVAATGGRLPELRLEQGLDGCLVVQLRYQVGPADALSYRQQLDLARLLIRQCQPEPAA